MKLLIASDLHGNLECTKLLIKKFHEYQADRLIILGDIYQGYSYTDSRMMANLFSTICTKLYLLKGNCDYINELNYSPVGFLEQYNIIINGHTIYFNHGHQGIPNVNFNKGDIYCHGHTHMNEISFYNDIIICCPGSMSMPRGGTKPSFMIVDDNGIYIYDLNDEIIKEYKFEV